MQKKFKIFMLLSSMLGFFISCSTTPLLFKIEPTSHDFGQVNIGTTASFDFIITNNKSVDMTLTVVTFSTGEFSEITNGQGKIITAKGTLLITVRFTPALPGGSKEDTMHLEWTDVNGKTGTKNVKLKGEAVPVAIINAPTTYDFGTVGIGLTATHNLNIENTGTANLILSLFNFVGNATLFSITAGGATPVTVMPGATHTVTIQFAPIATGDFPTVLEITHNAVNAVPPAQINIAAAGGGGRIELNQASPWDFGEVKTNGSKTDVVEVSNTGTIALNIQSIGLATGTEFSIESVEDSSGNPVTAPFAIQIGDFVEVTIRFAPTVAGNLDDELQIANDGSYAASPAQLELEGIGRAPIVQTFNYTGSRIQWTVPAGTHSISIECWGAQGGDNIALTDMGGKGARMKGDFSVNPAQILYIVVGQRGSNATSGNTANGAGGGGGGSFVWLSTNDTHPFIAAGGGGASCLQNNGMPHYQGKDGVTTEAGTGSRSHDQFSNSPGGTGGNDGKTIDQSGGKGWNSIKNNPAGDMACRYGGNGGYGGGGGCGCSGPNNYIHTGGGGGGYSGGGAGGTNYYFGGGGGGSYNAGTNQSNTAGVKTGNGQVIIEH